MQQRPDAADAFFNAFDQNSPVRRRGPPPPGPPPPQQQRQRGPPAPRPVAAAAAGPPPFRPPQQRPLPPQPQMPPSNSYVLSSGSGVGPQQQQTAGQPAGQPTSYYAPAPQQQQPQQQQPYGSQPQQQQSSNSDWYSPSTDSSYGVTQQPMVPSVLAPSVYTSSNAYLEGSMDTSARSTGSYGRTQQPQAFVPRQQQQQPRVATVTGQADLNDYYGEEPSLLEELGVNVEHILMKTKAVVIPFRRFQKQSALADPGIIVEDADLAGPLAFALLLGGELLLTGKLQFGYIYGFGLFGCLAMTLILNLMSPTAISFWTVTSILGYALLPVNILAAVKIVLFSFGTVVQLLAVLTVLWSTTASTRLLEIGCGLADQRYLLAYPIALLYSAFVLITIF